MGPEVWVDGRPLTSIDYWGDLTVTHRWGLDPTKPYAGSWEAKWAMPLRPGRRPAQLRANAPVEVKVGGWPIWAGTLVEPNWNDGAFAAVGAVRRAERVVCFDSSLNTTTVPDTAIDEAIARGKLPGWTRPASISAAPYVPADETAAPNYLAALLDAHALSVNKKWYLDASRAIHLLDDPTSPTAQVWPDNGVLGIAVEPQASVVYGRYLDTTSGIIETVSYPETPDPDDEAPELGVYIDPDKNGSLSEADAIARCQAIWAPLQAQPGWVNGITVTDGELRTMAGQKMAMWRFAAGRMVRLRGVRDLRGLSTDTDVVIGESIWTPGARTLTLNPVGKVARDIPSVLAATGEGLVLLS